MLLKMQLIPLINVIVLIRIFSLLQKCEANVDVVATAPVEVIEEGGVLSLHCQIWNKEKDQSVIILREVKGSIEQLSWNNLVMDPGEDDEERVFVAQRQLDDGSLVYFLSITDVTRHDTGMYSCKVMSAHMDSVVAVAKVDIRIYYVPSEEYPLCTAGVLTDPVDVGTEVTFNCTSETGYPDVSLIWKLSNGRELPTNVKTQGNMITALTTLRIQNTDNGLLLVCVATSRADSVYNKPCHIGPIAIISNPDLDIHDTNRLQITEKPKDNYENRETTHDIVAVKPSVSSCRRHCSTKYNLEYYWIIATIITGVFAALMLFIVLVLLCKYSRHVAKQHQQQYVTPSHGRPEEVYERLEFKACDKMMYMALKKPIGSAVLRELDIVARQTNMEQIEGGTLERYS